MAFKFRGRSRKVEGVVRRSKESSSDYDNYLVPGISKYKPREGENRVRILPPSDYGGNETKRRKHDEKWGDSWEIIVHMHRNVGPDETTYLCPKAMYNKRCSVCEARGDMDQEEADALRVQKRPFVWVIDRDNEKAGPQLWDMPMGLFRDINLRSVDKRTNELILVDDPEDGFDIEFTREGVDKRTKYVAVEVDRDSSPLHEKRTRMNKWLDYVSEHPLPSVLNFYDPDHVEKVLLGMAKKKRPADDDDEDEEEDEKPSRKKKRRKDDDEDEDDEDEKPSRRKRRRDDDDEDEDDEDEKPSRNRRRKDDDDEDEEDDDEDEKPSRKKKRRKDEDEDEDDEPPFDEDEEDEDGGDEDEDEEDEKPSRQAKRKLGKLRKKGRK